MIDAEINGQTLLIPFNDATTVRDFGVSTLNDYNKIFGCYKPYTIKYVKDCSNRILNNTLLIADLINKNVNNSNQKFEIIVEDQSDLSVKNKNNIDATKILQNHRVYQTYTIQQMNFCLKNRNLDNYMQFDVNTIHEYMLIIDEMLQIKDHEILTKLCIDTMDVLLVDEIGRHNPQLALPNKINLITWVFKNFMQLLNTYENASIIVYLFELVLNKHYHLFDSNQCIHNSMILPLIEHNMHRFPHIQSKILNLYESCIHLNKTKNHTSVKITKSSSNGKMKIPSQNSLYCKPDFERVANTISNGTLDVAESEAEYPTAASANNKYEMFKNSTGIESQYDRLTQLLLSDERNCRHFGVQKVKKMLSNYGLVTSNSNLVHTSNDAASSSMSICNDEDAEKISILLFQCIKLSMVPIPPKDLEVRSVHQFSVTTNVVMSTICNVPMTDIYSIVECMSCLELLYIQFPNGCMSCFIKYIKLILTLCHINTKYLKYGAFKTHQNSHHMNDADKDMNGRGQMQMNFIQDYDLICGLASQFFLSILKYIHGNSINEVAETNQLRDMYLNGWHELISNHHIQLEAGSLLQFIEIDNLPNGSGPLITANSSGPSTKLNLALIAMSYIVVKYIRSEEPNGKQERSRSRKGASRELVPNAVSHPTYDGLEILLIQDHFRMFRSVWHWMMLESMIKNENHNAAPQDHQKSNEFPMCVKLFEQYAIECVAHVCNYKPIKQYMIKFGAIDK